MEHVIHAGGRAAACLERADVPLDPFEAIGGSRGANGLKIRDAAGRQVVEHADPVPVPEQALREMGTDEAGSPGDEIVGHGRLDPKDAARAASLEDVPAIDHRARMAGHESEIEQLVRRRDHHAIRGPQGRGRERA